MERKWRNKGHCLYVCMTYPWPTRRWFCGMSWLFWLHRIPQNIVLRIKWNNMSKSVLWKLKIFGHMQVIKKNVLSWHFYLCWILCTLFAVLPSLPPPPWPLYLLLWGGARRGHEDIAAWRGAQLASFLTFAEMVTLPQLSFHYSFSYSLCIPGGISEQSLGFLICFPRTDSP